MLKKVICLTLLFVLLTQFNHAEAATVCLPSSYTGGTLTADSAFCTFQSPYTLTTDVIVEDGVTLYVEQGVTVRWEGERQLVVFGSLQATGTASEQITFTSATVPPEPHLAWWGIDFQPGSVDNELVFVNVEYTTGMFSIAGVRTHTDDLSFRNSTIRNGLGNGLEIHNAAPFLWQLDFIDNGGAAIVVSGESSPDWFGLDASGNGFDGVRFSANGSTSADLTLGDNGITDYQFTGDYTVEAATTMTIFPATTVGFKASECGDGLITVHGSLSAIGTSDRRINFTGQQVGCRGAGEWEGVHFSTTSHSNVLEYVNMFEGGGFGSSPMLRVETSGLSIRYSSLSQSGNAAMRVEAGSPMISHSNVFNNSGGIVNTGTGIVRAECVYWGATSGANSADNPTGTGQTVTGNADTLPYRTQFFLIEDTNCTATPTAVSMSYLAANGGGVRPIVILLAMLTLGCVSAMLRRYVVSAGG